MAKSYTRKKRRYRKRRHKRSKRKTARGIRDYGWSWNEGLYNKKSKGRMQYTNKNYKDARAEEREYRRSRRKFRRQSKNILQTPTTPVDGDMRYMHSLLSRTRASQLNHE